MASAPLLVVIAILGLFLWWYGGRTRPLTAAEIARFFDLMIARGVPAEAVKLAEKRLIRVNEAFEKIKNAKS